MFVVGTVLVCCCLLLVCWLLIVDCCDVCCDCCRCCDCCLFFFSTFLICCFVRLVSHLWFVVCCPLLVPCVFSALCLPIVGSAVLDVFVAFLVEVVGLLVFLGSSCYVLFVEFVVLISCRLHSLLALTILICLLYRLSLLCSLRFSSAAIVSCCLFCVSCCRSSLRNGCWAVWLTWVGQLAVCILVCLLACLLACLSVCLLAFACWIVYLFA